MHVYISVHGNGDANGSLHIHGASAGLTAHAVGDAALVGSAEVGLNVYGFLHGGIDQDDLVGRLFQIGDPTAVYCPHLGGSQTGRNIGVVGGEVFVGHFAAQNDLSVAVPEGQIGFDHSGVIRRQIGGAHRDLGHREEHAGELEGGAFHRFLQMPHGHIGMNGGIAAHLAEMEHIEPVFPAVVGGVAGTEHIAEGTHEGADVGLTEFDHHIGTDGPQGCQHILHQTVYRIVYRNEIHSLAHPVALGEAVDEVQLQTVNSPIPDGFGVFADDVFPYLGVAGIQNPGFVVPVRTKHLILKVWVTPGVFSHEGYGIPQHHFHADFMHLIHKGPHIGELFRRRYPVAAGAVHAAIDSGVPAVIYNDGVASQGVEIFALAEQCIGSDVLMVGVTNGLVDPVSRGHDYYNAQQYEIAVKLYSFSADTGNAQAQNSLANCYYCGYGVQQDYVEAIRLYKLSVGQGNRLAQSNLANCYYAGVGVTQDYNEAVRLYRMSAEQNNAWAQYRLGVCYYEGYGCCVDYDEAKKWLVLALGNGEQRAQEYLDKLP